MGTIEEIERRIEEADAARSARRTAAAKRVGELAHQRAAVAERLADIERDLGEVLAESSDIIEIDELARFTEVPVADLTRWLDCRKTGRVKRKRSNAGAPATKKDPSRGPAAAGTSAAGQASTLPASAEPRADTVHTPVRMAAARSDSVVLPGLRQ
ncbi:MULTISPECIES: hypothetical protein [unclassified Crossiella]|uniref:hypothetical protein n=1 Tax=unclassified Crossiella TaxID=2620835 RepID=UPI001FFE8ABA|nr:MULTISPECIES: hypothetical protein [unclassified Crossiella]MCK2239769.1 hypothetical protein [Crossiella sp. S99.2]MCK2252464.1 hypothetical protein [Crossiella sp. S99.1]